VRPGLTGAVSAGNAVEIVVTWKSADSPMRPELMTLNTAV
jgi:hypothetical protein